MDMKKSSLLLLMLFSAAHSFGQFYYDLVTRYMIDTAFLFQEVRNGVANNKKLCQFSDCLIYPIYMFRDITPHTKEDYLSGVFLNSLTTLHWMPSEYQLKNSRKGFGWVTTCDKILLVSTDGTYIGKADPDFYFSNSLCEYEDAVVITPDAALSDLLYHHVYDFLFCTTDYQPRDKIRVYFGVNKKKKSVDVLFYSRFGVKTMTMETAINENWEEFCHGFPNLQNRIFEELKIAFDSTMTDIPYIICD